MHSRPGPARPKLLIVAYACSPERGSEGGVGWNRAEQATSYCETWVICQGGPMREEIERRMSNPDMAPDVWDSKFPEIARFPECRQVDHVGKIEVNSFM